MTEDANTLRTLLDEIAGALKHTMPMDDALASTRPLAEQDDQNEEDDDAADTGGRPVLLINRWLEDVLRRGVHNVKEGELANPVFDVWKRAYRLEKPDKAEDSDEDLWPIYSRGVKRARERMKQKRV